MPPALRSALHMEFGVREGGSLRRLANLTGPSTRWDGFDSFQGLPTGRAEGVRSIRGWGASRYTTHGRLVHTYATCSHLFHRLFTPVPPLVHRYTTHGRLPTVPGHVELHVGWFNETVAPFLDRKLAKG